MTDKTYGICENCRPYIINLDTPLLRTPLPPFQGERLSKAHLLDLLMILPLAAIWAFLPNDGISVFAHWFFRQMVTLLGDLPHSRALETEADEVGLHLAARVSGKDWGTVWERMEGKSRAKETMLNRC